MIMISQYQGSALKICDAAENSTENKDAKAVMELKKKLLCLHTESQLLASRLYSDKYMLLQKHMMPAWFKFIGYRGNCCSFAQQSSLSWIIVKK